MVIGVLQVEVRVEWATCLKDKRRVVRSLKDRLHREHQVSVAEVGTLEDHRVATLGIVMATSSVNRAQQVLDQVLAKVGANRDWVLTDHTKEILTGH